MTKIRRQEADALHARRMRERPTRPFDSEAEGALLEYRFLAEKEAKESQTPEPAPDLSPCAKHPSWDPPRRLGQPRPPSSLCPLCIAEFDTQRSRTRELVHVDPHPTTAGQEIAWRKYIARFEALDPEPERGTPNWDRWWLREQKRRTGVLLSDPDSTAKQVEADALLAIEAKRDKDEHEKNRRPGGSFVVYSSPFAGGHDDASDRTIRKRRVRRDDGIVIGP
jgi:hypothetical protein